jgi:hypothetical protein
MSKLITAVFSLVLLSVFAPLRAEEADEHAIVPLQDASRPPTIQVHMMTGGITVRGEDRKDIAVEVHPRSGDSRHSRDRDEDRDSDDARSRGMHRLDLGGASGLDITEDNNVVSIKTSIFSGGGDLTILVPRHSSLQLKCMNDGELVVENVDGEIDADNLNGAITLKNVAGSVIAHSLNGAVTATLSRVDDAKPMSFSTMNGAIDVTLPATIHANVAMKTDNGEILSDFDVKLDGKTRTTSGENGRQPDGTYHLRLDKTLHGTINGGGPEYQFRSFNGQIFIRKSK